MEPWTKQKAARTALDAQDACNGTALAAALHEIGRAYLHSAGTDAANTSGPFRLMVYKIADLAGLALPFIDYERAAEECEAVAAGQPWPPPPDLRPYEERLADTRCKGDHRPGDGSYWARDGYGVELARVCDYCETVKLSRFRPDIRERYETDDTIDGEHSNDFQQDAATELEPFPSTANN